MKRGRGRPGKPFDHDGVRYETMRQLAEHLDVSEKTARKIRDEAIIGAIKVDEGVAIGGLRFNNKHEAAAKLEESIQHINVYLRIERKIRAMKREDLA